jgi:tetratricopeptide (TPR) repeat protein
MSSVADRTSIARQPGLDESETLRRADASLQAGDLSQAASLYDEILGRDPENAVALHSRGIVAFEENRTQLAVELIGRAVALNPRDVPALVNLGTALRGLGRWSEAADTYARAIAQNPDVVQAHAGKALADRELGRWEEALAGYDRALALEPAAAELHSDRGNVLEAVGQLDAALASYDRAIALCPGSFAAHFNRSWVLKRQACWEAALLCLDLALAIDPTHARAWSRRGDVLAALGRADAALESYRRALDHDPQNADAHYNCGVLYQDRNQLEPALGHYDRAIAVNPTFSGARFNRATVRLLRGDFADGWVDYESRWCNGHGNGFEPPRDFPYPRWDGRRFAAGARILLYAEQGFGDTVHFCRYAPLVAALGATVVLEVQPALVGLVKTLRGVAEVVARGERLPDVDWQCPLLSLPLILGTRLDSIPTPDRYLTSDSDRRERWRQRLGQRRSARVGLVWAGNPAHRRDTERRLSLAALCAALPASAEYVSLQREPAPEDHAVLAANPRLRNLGPELRDFEDTAALCDLLDLVISVDTGVAHVGGALGKPTWVLLPYVPDWRWLLARDDSPWYRSVRLYRQSQAGIWDDVLRRIACDLDAVALSRRSP